MWSLAVVEVIISSTEHRSGYLLIVWAAGMCEKVAFGQGYMTTFEAGAIEGTKAFAFESLGSRSRWDG